MAVERWHGLGFLAKGGLPLELNVWGSPRLWGTFPDFRVKKIQNVAQMSLFFFFSSLIFLAKKNPKN